MLEWEFKKFFLVGFDKNGDGKISMQEFLEVDKIHMIYVGLCHLLDGALNIQLSKSAIINYKSIILLSLILLNVA